VAELLDTTVASVNSALQRARRAAAERIPEQSQQATLRSLGDESARQLVVSYIDAFEHADIDGLVELLTEDAAWAMPPMRTWYHGREPIIPFLTEHALTTRWRHRPVSANGQLAVGCYAWLAEERHFAAAVVDVLTLRGDLIAEVTAFVSPRLSPASASQTSSVTDRSRRGSGSILRARLGLDRMLCGGAHPVPATADETKT
jgi:RNA polymerase sigma-70 factor, ECF subfamily